MSQAQDEPVQKKPGYYYEYKHEQLIRDGIRCIVEHKLFTDKESKFVNSFVRMIDKFGSPSFRQYILAYKIMWAHKDELDAHGLEVPDLPDARNFDLSKGSHSGGSKFEQAANGLAIAAQCRSDGMWKEINANKEKQRKRQQEDDEAMERWIAERNKLQLEASNMNTQQTAAIETEEVESREIAVIHRPQQNAVINWSDAVDLAKTARNMRKAIAKDVLVENTDFGKPFEGAPKPVLLLPGAQKITDAFECYAEPILLNKIENWDRREPLFHYHYRVNLRQRGTDAIISVGEGSANSNEAKWHWREGKRKCPKCQKETIFKGKDTTEKEGGWYCWAKKGGCGAKWPKNDEPTITSQTVERQPNEDIFDQVNTIQKIAIKRAHVAAAVNFGFSELFTQDLDDFVPPEHQGEHGTTTTSSKPAPATNGNEIPFPNGKNAGKTWAQLDDSMLTWVVENSKGDKVEKAKAEIERRKKAAESKAEVKTDGIKEPPSDARSAGFIPANDQEKEEANRLFVKLCAIADSKVFDKTQNEALLRCWNNYTTIKELRNYFEKAETAYNAKLKELRNSKTIENMFNEEMLKSTARLERDVHDSVNA